MFGDMNIAERLDEVKDSLAKCGADYVPLASDFYPQKLKWISDPPDFLFYKGSLDILKNTKSVAIVGTRAATNYGKNITKKISSMLAEHGIVIVSGLAAGIDSYAHEGTLNKGKTVAVLGTSIDTIYPISNEKLVKEIIKNDGLIISEYPPGIISQPWFFPQRNRIISALSDAVIVIEGDTQSGSLITARFAVKQGKPLFALPGPIDSPMSNGPNALIKSGVAKLLTSINDVLEAINEDKQLEFNLGDGKGKNIEGLSNAQKEVYELLSSSPLSFDELMSKTSFNVSDLSKDLTILEMKGLIERASEGGYVRGA